MIDRLSLCFIAVESDGADAVGEGDGWSDPPIVEP